MFKSFDCTFGVPLHFTGLAGQLGARVEIDHLSFSGAAPIEWRLHNESGPLKIGLFDVTGWRDGVRERSSLAEHDLQIHERGGVRGIPVKGLWLETRGFWRGKNLRQPAVRDL